MNDEEGVRGSLKKNLPPILDDSRKVLDTVAAKEQLAHYESIIRDAAVAAEHAKVAAKDAQTLMDRMSQGKGTVGALMHDEALYDDLQELMRDLKHNPWK